MDATAPPAPLRAAYSPEEFGRLLGISRGMVYKQLSAGIIRSVLIGRSRRIPASELGRLLADPAA